MHRVLSNLSMRIKQLEQRLDKNFFLREKRGLILMPDGRLLLTYAERLIQLLEEAPNALPDHMDRIKTLLCWREDYRSAKLDALKDLLPTI